MRVVYREDQQQREHEVLSEEAAFADGTEGRRSSSEPDALRTDYQRDRDKILHSKSFRRLSHKTQVFLASEGDHFRTRLTHTLEVAQIARTITRALGLNEDLTEAISLAHDLGHTPFGHAGEKALNALCPDGFHHYMQSLRVVDRLEKDGEGLNLTWEVRDGILCHSGKQFPATLEGQCVRRADRIADKPKLTMSPLVQETMDGLREFMFARVYRDQWRQAEEERCKHVVEALFSYYSEHPGEMPEEFVLIGYKEGTARAVCDFVSCMTDRYAIRTYQQLFVPSGFSAI